MCGVGIFPLSRPSANPPENGLNPAPPGVLDVACVGRDLGICRSVNPSSPTPDVSPASHPTQPFCAHSSAPLPIGVILKDPAYRVRVRRNGNP